MFSTQEAQCHEAPIGYYIDSTQKELVKCPALTTTYTTKSLSAEQCVCAGGLKTVTLLGIATCVPCVLDEVCSIMQRGGISQCRLYKQTVNQRNDVCVCEAGYYDNMATRLGAMKCTMCPAGFYCPQERNINIQPTILRCPYRTTSHPGTPSVDGCFCQQSDRNLMASPVPPFAFECLCPSSHYEVGANSPCTPCPSNMFVSIQSILSRTARQLPSCSCVSGFYSQTVENEDGTSITECVICPAGYYCTAGQTDNGPVACPIGTFGPAIGHGNERGCLQCPHAMTAFDNPNNSHVVGDTNRVDKRTSLNARALQGSVIDCFSSYTPIYTTRELDLQLCSCVFVVLSKDIKKKELLAGLHRVFNHDLASVDAVSSLGRVQFSVTLTAEFSMAILFAISQIDAIWANIRSVSQVNPTMYISMIRYIFCDTVQQIANDIYEGNVDISVCYMPMDRMTIIGIVFSR